MDKGLTKAVEKFTSNVSIALEKAAEGTKLDNTANKLTQDTIVEAFNLCVAFIDINDRHSDEELWAVVAAFSQHDLLPGATTPDGLRRNSLISGKKTNIETPSAMFETFVKVDEAKGTKLSQTYFNEAIELAHVVVSLDQFANDQALQAIVDFRRTLENKLPKKATEGGKPNNVEVEELGPPEDLEELLAELDELIGLEVVKEEVKLLSAMLRVQKLREERGLAVVDSTKHLIFSGNPGTGKTTVARLLSRIYRTLGIVEKGHLVEVDRSGLVVGFVGQTATKVGEVFDAADGGVLLIDEAYSLTRGGEKDFGREAIDAVVKNVEDRRDSMVVILTGYPKEMADLVGANPGIKSRFPKTIHFPDYTTEELIGILKLITKKGEYKLTEEAVEAATVWLDAHERGHGFGNGRLSRNLFEAAVAQHAKRVTEVENPTDDELTYLETEDIASVAVKL